MQKGIDLTQPKRIHIVGIGGAGMSSLAVLLLEMNHKVSGSDQIDSDILKQLSDMGAQVFSGHSPKNLDDKPGDIDFITHSSAIPDSNSELEYARAQNIDVYSRAEVLAAVSKIKSTLVVAGSHGKTTTTAMLTKILAPTSYLVGGCLIEAESETKLGGHWDPKSKWMVIEGDESDKTFVELQADMAIITSMDPDHLEHYGSEEKLMEVYYDFAQGNTPLNPSSNPVSSKAKAFEGPRAVICNTDDKRVAQLAKDLKEELKDKLQNILTFGTCGMPDFLIEDFSSDQNGSRAQVSRTKFDEKITDKVCIEIPQPGLHNMYNATAAYVAGLQLDQSSQNILNALSSFVGVERRFQIKGIAKGITFIDDYAHTPREISLTLEAVSDWGRVLCVFQPHRYSRVETLWESYKEAFKNCDLLVVTEIYSAGEPAREKINGKLILDAALSAYPRKPSAWIPRKEDLVNYCLKHLRPGDIFITLNAGDLFEIGEEILHQIKKSDEDVSEN